MKKNSKEVLKKTITLKQVQGGFEMEYTLEHALALLRLQEQSKAKGWIVFDKKWTFKDNEITRK